MAKIYFYLVIFLNRILPLRSVPVLLYHSISQDANKLSVSPERFAEQLSRLKTNNYQTIKPTDLLGYLAIGKFPRHKIIISFDDGFEDNFKVAGPVLKKYGFMATVFIAGKYIGQKGSFCTDEINKQKSIVSSEQIFKMKEEGFVIANHFFSHIPVDRLSNNEIVREFEDNRKILSEIIGQSDNLYFVAYPKNKKSKNEELLRSLKIKLGFAGGSGVCNKKNNPLDIPRIEVFNEDNDLKFMARLSPYYYFGLKLFGRIKKQ